MSAFYDLASVVLVPSGYKSGKIYAQKPLTTDGQLTFTRASTATRVNASGLIEEVASGVPRLDYLGSTCPKLQLEPSRTNLKTYSEDATGTNWGIAINVNVTSNQVASPDGNITSDSIEDTAANARHWFEYFFSATSGTAYTLSFFAKANTLSQCAIYGYADNSVFGAQQAIFNLLTGTIVSNTGGGTAAITPYGSGWYRVSLTLTAGATANGYWAFGLAKNGNTTYLGNGSSLYMWGVQHEAGAYATSYIPTTTAAVTRLADAAYKTGISSLIGQTEGTLFIDVSGPSKTGDARYMTVSDGTGSNRIVIYSTTLTSIGVYLQNSSGTSALGFNTVNGRMKIAFAYKNNDLQVYLNGVLKDTITSFTSSFTLNSVSVGTYEDTAVYNSLGQSVSQALLFKTRLTNAQLAELTTL